MGGPGAGVAGEFGRVLDAATAILVDGNARRVEGMIRDGVDLGFPMGLAGALAHASYIGRARPGGIPSSDLLGGD